MFKIFATILMVSDTGSVATSIFSTDIQNGQLCNAIKRDFFTNDSIQDVGGHKITIKVKSQCIYMGGPEANMNTIPPQITGMVRGFFNGLDIR